ncbi:monoacylglycerol lipase ABHD2-like [Ruditapes philippinarum]|uniref:monoacylglycerol lipase ABHD2-like n=1 Tax=Ruditapes philippinarum TaxID=129788 RepID=UPI00295A8F03|nr:monoacylglycerol lipase ABHD2-like [Ruditapes philippinarum]
MAKELEEEQCRILSSPERPKLYYKSLGSPFVQAILEKCPILTQVFKPTILWGKSGHFQTIVHVKMGRTKPKWPDGKRFHILMEDGATMSYDLFDPHQEGHRAKFTLALCPGIANSSECIYLRTFASYAQTRGFRVAILNHLGALKSEKLTSPRVFTYGGTGEYSRMVDHLLEQYPDTKILAVGFSMGGNIVTNYLGEILENQKKVLCGVSVCQGYEINEAKDLFMQWANLRRLYTYFMTLNQRRLLSRHREFLFSEKAQQKCGAFKEKEVFCATSLIDVDENYSRIRAGFKSAFEYYKRHSSAYVMKNIKVPMLLMNAADDPLVPPPLYKHPKQFVEKNENCIFMTTKHGGHLGYFEGGLLVPENVTWLDRVIIEYADAVTSLYLQGNLPQQTGSLVLSPETAENAETTFDSGIADLSWEGRAFSSDEPASPETEVKDSGKKVADDKKKESLKRGSLLKQASTYVQ